MSQLLRCFHRAFREHARGFRSTQAEAFASGDSLPRRTKFGFCSKVLCPRVCQRWDEASWERVGTMILALRQ
eukprot:8413984-Alexandrium_andersonii.AAC.1